MRTPTPKINLPIRALALSAAAGLSTSVASGQSTFTWNGSGSGGTTSTTWESAANWLPALTGFPGINDTAIFSMGGNVAGGSAARIEVPVGAALRLVGSTTLDGELVNDGTLTFTADNSDGGAPGQLDRRLLVPASGLVLLQGTGSATLNGSATGFQGADRATSEVTNTASHTITGGGSIRDLRFNNSGTISTTGDFLIINSDFLNVGGQFTQDTNTLSFNNSTANFLIANVINDGNLSITNGSNLTSSVFTTGTSIDIEISNASLAQVGGTVLTSESGSVSGGPETLPGRVTGNWNNSGAQAFSDSLAYTGTMTNDGTFTFQLDGSNGGSNQFLDQRFSIEDGAPMTLQGTGSFVLGGTATGLQGQSTAGSMLTHGGSHTITGSGVIVDLTLRNSATIDGTGTFSLTNLDVNNVGGQINQSSGTMTVSNSTINGGSSDIGASATVRYSGSNAVYDSVTSAGTLEVTSGTLTAAVNTSGGVVSGVDESGQSLTGDWMNSGAVQLRGGLTYQGTLTNTGTMTFLADGSNGATGTILDQRLEVAAGTSATFTGAGSIVLAGAATGIEGVDATSVLNNTGGHTITGLGQFQDLTINNAGGTIANTGRLDLIRVDISGGNADFAAGESVFLNDVDFDGTSIASAGTIDFASASTLSNVALTTTGGLLEGVDETESSRISGAWMNTGPLEIRGAIAFSGTLTNTGNISLRLDNSNGATGSILDQRIAIPTGTSAAMTGAGVFTMGGSATGIEGNGIGNSFLTNTGGHTIAGAGVIDSLSVTNEALIAPTGTMTISNSAVDSTLGDFDQSDGTLSFVNSSLNGGDIDVQPMAGVSFSGSQATLSTVELLADATLTLSQSGLSTNLSTSSGTIDGSSETGSSFSGNWTNTGPIEWRSGVLFQGTLQNTGVITFRTDSTNGGNGSFLDQRLAIASGTQATLTGQGSLVLSGAATGVQGEGPASLLVNTGGHTIGGQGTITDLSIDNDQGIITTSGRTQVTNTMITDGLVEIPQGNEIELRNSTIDGAEVRSAGTLEFASPSSLTSIQLITNGGMIDGASERDESLVQGIWMNRAPTVIDNAITVSGELNNTSTLTISPDASNGGNGSLLDRRIVIPASTITTFSGTGELVTNGRATGLQGAGETSSRIANLSGHTISGDGTIDGLTLSNNGTIAPLGTMRFDEVAVVTGAAGRYQFRFSQSEQGRIETTRAFVAAGTIDVGFTDSFRPNPNDNFNLVQSAVPHVGRFSNAPSDGAGIANVTTPTATFTLFYGGPGSTQITITNIRALASANPDFNNDGMIDIFDFIDYMAAFDADDLSAEADGAAGLTTGDITAFLQTLGF